MNTTTKVSLALLLVLTVATLSAVATKTDTNEYIPPEPVKEKLESNIEPEVVFDIEEARCLAENIYHEARGQGTAGWLAVAAVTLNRVTDERFPDTICGVVFQAETRESWKTKGKDVPDIERIYYPVRHRCQFSWYCDGMSDDINQIDIYVRARCVRTLHCPLSVLPVPLIVLQTAR